MKIIITQLEIEEAIRNHILGQISVKEGMVIDIELAATRGDTGFTATIDIHAAEIKADPVPEKVTRAYVRKAVEAAPAAVVQEQAPEQVAGSATAASPEPTQAQPSEELAEVATPAPAPLTGALVKSLFGNLKAPTNTPSA